MKVKIRKDGETNPPVFDFSRGVVYLDKYPDEVEVLYQADDEIVAGFSTLVTIEGVNYLMMSIDLEY